MKTKVKYIDNDVYSEAKSRIKHIILSFDKLFVCFSGGKDSLVVLNLLEDVHKELGIKEKINVIFRDEELIPDNVINFVQEHAKKTDKYNFYYYAVPLYSNKFILGKTIEYVSHSDMLIRKLSKEAKDIIESEIWQLLFENKLKKDDKASNKYSFENSNNRTGLTAGTMGGAITGLDAENPNIKSFSGALIIDDPIDVGNARHALAKEECIRFYTDKLSTRRRDPKVPTILIMQRVDKEDLPGWIAEKEPEEWDIVKIPALNEKNESFWAERYPVSELLKEKNINPFKFYSQYQQEPITAGGQVIKTKWWQYYFDKEIENISFNRIFITVDTAQKTKEHNDYSVFTCWGLADNLYLLDGIRGKWEAPDLRKEALRFWQKWQNGLKGRPCQAFYVEDKSSGTGLIQDLMRVSYIPIIGVQRDTDKLTRLEDVLYYIASGRVYLPKELTFTDELISEAKAFTRNMSHKHDDIIDCVIDAVNKAFNVGELSILDVID